MTSLLEVRDLTIRFPRPEGWVSVVRNLSLSIGAGEMVGLVGESGSGKSLSALAMLSLVPPPGRIAGGQVLLEGQEISSWSEKRLQKVRGGQIGIVFQEPMTALNPVFSIGFQVAEAVRAHRKVSRKEALEEAAELLDRVAIADARERLKDYPHQLSGGQRQRVMIAIALAGRPKLLLADEPTTALDVTIQAQILELLQSLREDLGLAVLLISHDLAVVAETCERVLVMYCGELVEEAPVADLFRDPAHPYTRGLLKALPHLGRRLEDDRLPAIPGQVPEPQNRPPGCAFHPRCEHAWDLCRAEEPDLLPLAGAGRRARCFLHGPQAVEAAEG